jgi:thymidylate kinase
MIIVFEGPDGCGKTTLAKSVSSVFSIPIYKPAGTPLTGITVAESQAEDRGAWGLVALLAPSVHVIFDRAFPSEWVYGMAFDRQFDTEAVWSLDAQLASMPHLCYLVLPKKIAARGVLHHWLRNRGVDDVTPERWQEIASGYADYCSLSRLDWKTIDQDDADRVHRDVRRSLEDVHVC